MEKKVNEGFYEGWFSCDFRKLTSLEGVPKEVVGGSFGTTGVLTSLEGVPKEVVGGSFGTTGVLTSLEGAPKKVGGSFGTTGVLTSLDKGDSKQLLTLERAEN